MDPTGLRGGIYLGSGWGGTCWTRGRMIFFSSIALVPPGPGFRARATAIRRQRRRGACLCHRARSAEAIRSRVLMAKWMVWLPHTVRCDWCIACC